MSIDFRRDERCHKGICLAPASPGQGEGANPDPAANVDLAGNLRAEGHLQWAQGGGGFFQDTGSQVVRLWADARFIEDVGGTAFDPIHALARLDRDIRAANNTSKLTVILTIRSTFRGHRDPALGTTPDVWPSVAALTPPTTDAPGGGWVEWARYLALRYHPDPAVRNWEAHREAPQVNPYTKQPVRDANGRQLIEVLPDRGGANYSPNGGTPLPRHESGPWIDYLEFVNEPNYEYTPQSVAVERTWLMFRAIQALEPQVNAITTIARDPANNVVYNPDGTIATITNTSAAPLRFVGPATSDSVNSNATLYHRFLKALWDRDTTAEPVMRTLNPTRFYFSHHSYIDGEKQRFEKSNYPKTPTPETNSVAWVNGLLRDRYHRVQDGQSLTLLVTEGGVRRTKLLSEKGVRELAADRRITTGKGRRKTTRRNPAYRAISRLARYGGSKAAREKLKAEDLLDVQYGIAYWAQEIEEEQADRLRRSVETAKKHGARLFVQFLSWAVTDEGPTPGGASRAAVKQGKANGLNSCDLVIRAAGREWSLDNYGRRNDHQPSESDPSDTDLSNRRRYNYAEAAAARRSGSGTNRALTRKAYFAWKKLKL